MSGQVKYIFLVNPFEEKKVESSIDDNKYTDIDFMIC